VSEIHKSKYTYPRYLYMIPYLLVAVTFPLIILFIGLYLLALMFGIGETVMEHRNDFLAAIASLLILFVGPMYTLNEYSDIQLLDNGLKVRIFITFIPLWKYVGWEDIIRIPKSKKVDRFFKPIYLIQVKKLTIWHSFLGWRHAGFWQPVLLITSDMNNRDELIELINKQLRLKAT